jgi:hypothetical protein
MTNLVRSLTRLLIACLRPLVILLAACLGASGVAHAYWLATGSGPGAGVAASSVALTVSPGSPVSNLVPAGQADVLLTASNPNFNPTTITAFTLDTGQGNGGFAVDAGHSGCATSTLSFVTQTNGGAGWVVPARVGAVNGSLAVTLLHALSMGVGAANACQGATITVYVAA